MSGPYEDTSDSDERRRAMYAQIQADEDERERREQAAYEARLRFRDKLFGTDDDFARQAPEPLTDHDTLLGEHLAQLRNAARHGMTYALRDYSTGDQFARAANAIGAIVRTNLAIVKALKSGPNARTPKTVHGGAPLTEPQD